MLVVVAPEEAQARWLSLPGRALVPSTAASTQPKLLQGFY